LVRCSGPYVVFTLLLQRWEFRCSSCPTNPWWRSLWSQWC
jgi:hypothetical protein